MLVLGIDPGTQVCGWGLVAYDSRRPVHVGHGAVRLVGTLAERLGALFAALEEVIRLHRPDVVAVEGVFTHRNARSALVLGHARGVALLCAARSGLAVHEYAPATVKKAVVGTGRAEKHQIQRMVSVLLGIPEPEVADAADAVAIALCHLQHLGPPGAARGAPAVVRHRAPRAAVIRYRTKGGTE